MIRSAILRRLQIVRLVIQLYRTFKRIRRFEAHKTDPRQVEELYARAGRDIRETANRLCGAIVKAGQFLSLREELFPEAFTRELQGLQDQIPAAPFAAVQASLAVDQKWPIKDIFSQIEEEPIASASLAQVHLAKLMDGQAVAVKVLRPGIEQLVAIDMSTLGHVVHVFDWLPGLRKRMNFVALHREFVDTLAKELDMYDEADQLHRFRQSIGDDSRIVIPRVYDDYTTQRVLVMSYVAGANVRDTEQLKVWHVNRCAVRDALLDVYLKQILVNGFVHLDPHPGNLLVQSDGRLAMLDFGMVGEYSFAERKAFRSMIQCAFFRDVQGVVNGLQELGYVKTDEDAAEFVRSFGSLLGSIDPVLLGTILAHKSFHFQAKYMLLIRCLGLLKTVMTTLTPEETDWFGVLSERALPILMSKKEIG